MKKHILYITTLLLLSFTACEEYLDTMPDNRAELDSKEKIEKLLVAAYPYGSYLLVTEFSSDNVDDYGVKNPNTNRFWEQIAYWKDITETNNDDARRIWSSCYLAISNANEALKAIEEMGNPEDLQAAKGEALITRAYAHFVLVNVFSMHYNTQTSGSDLGVPYMEKAETTLDPKYERGNVAEVYEKINKDIEVGLPLINDETYSVPKYHFNQSAAYAFAARFYLYYEKWDKAVEYASKVLGSNPQQLLRNWEEMGALPRTSDVVVNHYIQDSHKCNLLIQAYTSSVGTVFGPYYTASRFAHGKELASTETLNQRQVWMTSNSGSTYHYRPFVYGGTNLDKSLILKVPYQFEYTDPIAGIGFQKSTLVLFSTDETLLVRAEAYAMLKKYDLATQDVNTWTKNFTKSNKTYTADEINEFYSNVPYYEKNQRTFKKRLNPKFQIEQGMQENMLHCILQCRRILTLHEGLRWFDIKRYGIEIDRYQETTTGNWHIEESLSKDDPRRAIQVPRDVIDAGLEPNPR